MLKPRLGCYAVYEPDEEGWGNLDQQFASINQDLITAGLDVVPAPEPVKDLSSTERIAAWFKEQDIDLLHALIVTWSFDHYTIMIQSHIDLPVAIRSIPGIRTGSLVGGQQLNCIMSDIEAPHKHFFGPLGSARTAQEIADYSRAIAIKNKLNGARMAVVGRRTEGMTPTAVDEVEILRLFGTRLLNYGLDEIEEKANQVKQSEAQEVWTKIKIGAMGVTSKEEHGLKTARNFLVLKGMVEELGLDAISIGSYPKCQGTMCVPIALLNDEGIPTGCEGDVNSTLAMLILNQLSEDAVHFGEMLAVDEDANTMVTSHCGCGSLSLANDGEYLLCPVRLANDGVCVRYTAKPGPVTFVNLVGRKGNYRLCAFEGQAVPTEMVFEGNPLKFVMKTPFQKIWKEVSAGGFGHHWMTVYSYAVPVLQEFCKITGIKGAFPDHLP